MQWEEPYHLFNYNQKKKNFFNLHRRKDIQDAQSPNVDVIRRWLIMCLEPRYKRITIQWTYKIQSKTNAILR